MKVFQHPNPAWRARGDTLISIDLPDEVREQVWARRMGGDLYQICCVPFFAYDVALGDVVRAPDLVFERVVEESGRYVLRIFFQKTDRAREIIDELTNAGCTVELRGRLVAIDVRSQEIAEAVSGRLAAYEASEVLHLETGRT